MEFYEMIYTMVLSIGFVAVILTVGVETVSYFCAKGWYSGKKEYNKNNVIEVNIKG